MALAFFDHEALRVDDSEQRPVIDTAGWGVAGWWWRGRHWRLAELIDALPGQRGDLKRRHRQAMILLDMNMRHLTDQLNEATDRGECSGR